MPLNIKLDVFEGPLDLLLHLIKKSEVDIYNIPIAEITDQYISYLKAMEELDLDIASEFLVMAATLIEIKSKMLLPKKKDEESAADEDPRVELVEKLVEYKKYKEFAALLKDIGENNELYFKAPEIIDDLEENKEVFFRNITLDSLMHAFSDIVRQHNNRYNKRSVIPENIDFDEYRIEDKMDDITRMLKVKKTAPLEEFFIKAESKMELIVIFLAVLELIKERYIKVVQYESFGDIVLEGQEIIWKTS